MRSGIEATVANAICLAPGVVTPPTSIATGCQTDATNAMLAWLATVPDNSTMTFKPGACYRIEGTLLLLSRSGLVFEGNGATFRSFNTMTTGNAEDDQRAMWRFVGSSGIVMRNMNLVGAYTQGGTHDPTLQHAHAIDLRGTSATVSYVTMEDFAGDGVYFGLNYLDSVGRASGTVSDCSIVSIGRNGVSYVAADNVTVQRTFTDVIGYIAHDVEPNALSGFEVHSVSVTNNTIGSYVINAFTIFGEAPVSDISFTNNWITAPIGGRLGITSTAVRRSNVTITGNTATQTLTYPQAIRMENTDGVVVTGNSLPITGVMMACASVTAVTFSGNTPNTQSGC